MAGSKFQGLNREGIRLQNPPPLFVPGKAGLMIRMKPYQGDKMYEPHLRWSYWCHPITLRIDPRDRIELSPSGHESEVLPLHYRGSLTDCY